MISREEIQNLAQLSRLELSEKEIGSLQKEFSSILEYIGQIQSLSSKGVAFADSAQAIPLYNVMREDVATETSPSAREALLAAAPKREGDYFVVRKIIDKE